jgi:hypothetical protein
MAIQPNLPNPSFADASAYDSDDEATNASASISSSSSSSSGVVLGFDDGEIEVNDENSDEADLTVSRIGGRPVGEASSTQSGYSDNGNYSISLSKL